jgi:hypothetical protein
MHLCKCLGWSSREELIDDVRPVIRLSQNPRLADLSKAPQRLD